mmetsp:Transcript_30389/g.62611  ORF Transcript_30389/g.62611 Transcript_30389/m.62611 type:complete len:957 (-) Transcript_30389:6440-9310(-)
MPGEGIVAGEKAAPPSESSEQEISWEELSATEAALLNAKEAKEAGQEVLPELVDHSILPAPVTERPIPPPPLYPNIKPTVPMASAGARPKCAGCVKSVRTNQMDASWKCNCSPPRVLHQKCRIAILQSIAEAHGFVTVDGKGDYKCAAMVAILGNPTAYYKDEKSGEVAGYLTVDAFRCPDCVGHMSSPHCVPRSLFRGADDGSGSSGDEGLEEPTFTTALSGDSDAGADARRVIIAPPQVAPVKLEPGMSSVVGQAVGEAGEGSKDPVISSRGLTRADFSLVATIARTAAADDGSTSAAQAILVSGVIGASSRSVRTQALEMGWIQDIDFPTWCPPEAWEDLAKAMECSLAPRASARPPPDTTPVVTKPKVVNAIARPADPPTPESALEVVDSAAIVLRQLGTQLDTLPVSEYPALHHTLVHAHAEIQSVTTAVLGWDPVTRQFSKGHQMDMLRSMLGSYAGTRRAPLAPPTGIAGGVREMTTQAASGNSGAAANTKGKATAAVVVQPPLPNPVGLPGRVSLASLGAEEAEVVSGNSRIVDQAVPSGGDSSAAASSAGTGGSSTNVRGGAARGASSIEHTLLGPTGQVAHGRPHPEVQAVRDLYDTTEQHECLKAGEDSSAGLVLTTMESLAEVKRGWRKVRHLRARLLGTPAKLTGAEISEDGEVRIPSDLVCEVKSSGDWDAPELTHWLETTEQLVTVIDRRDGSELYIPWRRLVETTKAKKSKFWGLGIRATAASANEDLRTTLTLMASFRWLMSSPEIGGSGASIAEIWREFMEEAGGQAATIHLQTPERARALKRAGLGSAAATSYSSSAFASPSPGPGPTGGVGSPVLVWGPEHGMEPTPEQVRETEIGFLNPNFCKNCNQNAGHPSPLCDRPRRPELPCVFCMGRHRELDCPGPGERSRPAFEVKRKFYFQRVNSAIPRRLAPPGAGTAGAPVPSAAAPPDGGASAGK